MAARVDRGRSRWPLWARAGLLAFAAVALAPVAAGAQGRTEGARPLGMGSAFTANASGNGAIYHNPAGVASIFIYSLEGSYFLSPGFNTLNTSVVDSKLNTKLAAGAAYSFDFSSDNAKVKAHDARLALASQLIPDRMILGVGGRYLFATQAKEEILNSFTLDVGTVVRIADGFFVGVSGNNLIDPCKDRGAECPASAGPRSLSSGLSLGSSAGFQLSADLRTDFSTKEERDEVGFVYAAGVEVLAAQILALRAGYQFHDLDQEHVMAAGGGLKTEAIGLDVGFQFNFAQESSLLSVALQFYFF